MYRLLLLLAMFSIVACGPTDRAETGAITSVADQAKQERNEAQDAVAAIEAAARRDDEAASRIQRDGDKPAD